MLSPHGARPRCGGSWRFAIRRKGSPEVIVDSSALIAVLNREPDAQEYETAIATSMNCQISAANLLEAAIVVESRGGIEAGNELDAFLETAGIETAPVTGEQSRVARQAWRQFGKGRHRAALNFGDCFAYALSRVTGEALLYKGNDFSHTDIPAALPSSSANGG